MKDEEYAAWVKSLKPGDEVAVVTDSWGIRHSVEYNTVEKVTPTGRIVVTSKLKNGTAMTFRPDGSDRRGGHYDGYWTVLAPRSQELSDWMEKVRSLRVIQSVTWKDLPLEKLRQVRQIVESP